MLLYIYIYKKSHVPLFLHERIFFIGTEIKVSGLNKKKDPLEKKSWDIFFSLVRTRCYICFKDFDFFTYV